MIVINQRCMHNYCRSLPTGSASSSAPPQAACGSAQLSGGSVGLSGTSSPPAHSAAPPPSCPCAGSFAAGHPAVLTPAACAAALAAPCSQPARTIHRQLHGSQKMISIAVLTQAACTAALAALCFLQPVRQQTRCVQQQDSSTITSISHTDPSCIAAPAVCCQVQPTATLFCGLYVGGGRGGEGGRVQLQGQH
jgi:hypothetical protein